MSPSQVSRAENTRTYICHSRSCLSPVRASELSKRGSLPNFWRSRVSHVSCLPGASRCRRSQGARDSESLGVSSFVGVQWLSATAAAGESFGTEGAAADQTKILPRNVCSVGMVSIDGVQHQFRKPDLAPTLPRPRQIRPLVEDECSHFDPCHLSPVARQC